MKNAEEKKPASLSAEMAVIGSCLVDQVAAGTACMMLEAEHFENVECRAIFEAVKSARRVGVPVDAVTVLDHVKGAVSASMRSLIVSVVEHVPTALHVVHYADMVRAAATQRELDAAYKDAMMDPNDWGIRAKIQSLWAESSGRRSVVVNMPEGIKAYMEEIERRVEGKSLPPISMGFTSMDGMLGGGLRPGQVLTVAARTGRGKTALLVNLTSNFINRGHKTLFFSSEMTHEEIMDRMVSFRTGIPHGRLRHRPHMEEFRRVSQEVAEMASLPLVVNDIGSLTVPSVFSITDSVRPQIIIVDFVQRFGPVPSNGNRAAFFSDAANAMKTLARDRGAVVILASQISRGTEFDDREPTLADLKESGGIEEASDIVLILHSKRDDQNKDPRPYKFIIAKQRNGPIGSLQMNFRPSFTRFEEIALEGDEDYHGNFV